MHLSLCCDATKRIVTSRDFPVDDDDVAFREIGGVAEGEYTLFIIVLQKMHIFNEIF